MNKRFGQKLTYFVLEVTFFASIVALVLVRPHANMPLWLLGIMTFACFRAAITISENEIMAWLRDPFTETKLDSCGAGNSISPATSGPASKGWKRAMGGLIACPICTGTWCALALMAVWTITPGFGTVLIEVLFVAGISELLVSLREFLCWNARLARVRAGQISPDQD